MFKTQIVNGSQLILLREKAKLTQAQLAKKAGFSKRTLERAERSENLRTKYISQLAKALNVRTKELVLGEDPGSLRANFSVYLKHIRLEFQDIQMMEISGSDVGADPSKGHIPQLEKLFVEPHLLDKAASPESVTENWDGNSLATKCLTKSGSHFVILGDPGSGKSTLVAWITLQLTSATPFSHALGDRIPISMILRELHLAEAMKKPEFTWEDLLRAYQNWCGKDKEFAESVAGDRLFQLIRDGKAVLMLDGLDEIGLEAREKIRSAIWGLLQKYPDNIIICTSRPVGYEDMPFDWSLDLSGLHKKIENPPYFESGVKSLAEVSIDKKRSGSKTRFVLPVPDPTGHQEVFSSFSQIQELPKMQRLYLAPFDNTQIKGFIDHWYKRRPVSAGRSSERATKLLSLVLNNQSIRTLARIPNILTLMAILHERRDVLPDGRAMLYEAITDLYLVYIDQKRGIPRNSDIRSTTDEQKRWLGRVAWEIQLRRAANELQDDEHLVNEEALLLVTLDEMVAWIQDERQDDLWIDPSDTEVRAFLEMVRVRSGLLIDRAQGRYAFIHLSFMEFFAGHYLVHRHEKMLREDSLAPRSLTGRTIWHEVLVFAMEDAKAFFSDKWKTLVKGLFPVLAKTGALTPQITGKSKAEIISESNEWILLTRLGEDRHTKFEPQRDRIRYACVYWACQVDPLNVYSFKRTSRFRNEWLEEFDDPKVRTIQRWSLIQHFVEASNYGTLGVLALVGFEVNDSEVAQIVTQWPNLTWLDLSDNQIGDAGARAIAEQLANLTSLYICNNQISDAGARAIAEQLVNLTSLSLWSNQIGDAGARAIAEQLTNLTSLNLSHNQIGDAGARAIAEQLTNLTSLYLRYNQIGDAGARVIAEQLTNLTSLDLWNNQIGDAGARAIAEQLTNLTSLNLNTNQIGEAGARAIAEQLTNLTSLSLWSNQIGDAGARVIAEQLTNLTSLDLWNNQIGDAGARAIAEQLTNLTSLSLWSNQIGEAGARAIAEQLTNLTSLNLSHNQIGEAGARAIAEQLTNLTSLDLRNNQIGDETKRQLHEQLKDRIEELLL